MLAPLGVDLALTTNGVKLAEVAHELQHGRARPGERLADTLRPDRILAITRRDDLDRVPRGSTARRRRPRAGQGQRRRDARRERRRDRRPRAVPSRPRLGMRFIEFMPLDAQGEWSEDQVVPAARLSSVSPRSSRWSRATTTDVEPAARWRLRDGCGDVGVIPSVTEPFCESCDRVRITAEGQFRTCPFALDETDLRASYAPR